MNRLLFFLILFLFLGAAFLLGFKFFCPTCQAREKSSQVNSPQFTYLPRSPLIGETPDSVRSGLPAPYFVLKDLNEKTVSLDDFKDKNVLLVFWATYCGWCAKEKEDLNRFTQEQKGKIEVVAIDNEPRQVLLDYVSKEGINFLILPDEGRATFEKYQVLGTPAHFLINKEGKIVAKRPGYASYADLLMLAQILEEK